MRYGFTTGSCAAAASKAALYMLLTGNKKEEISIITPKGIEFKAAICNICRTECSVSCSVVKDGGDDPDVTSGCHIVSEVSLLPLDNRILIEGGKGVGTVTLPGLDQKPGMAAINHVPREMICKEVEEVCSVLDYTGGVKVIISVPEGEELAAKTFNPRLGIKGGISILGTSGIVEPMSAQALKDTIKVELRQKKEMGLSVAAVTPGNYGLDFMKNSFGYDLDKSVKCSNYIGDTIDMCIEAGFSKMLLTGHIGKLIKVSGGIMNTHSAEGDCRMELLCSASVKAGASSEVALKILECVSTEEAVRIIKEHGILEPVMRIVMERIMFFLNKRGMDKIEIGCMVYCNEFGLLAGSQNADCMLRECL